MSALIVLFSSAVNEDWLMLYFARVLVMRSAIGDLHHYGLAPRGDLRDREVAEAGHVAPGGVVGRLLPLGVEGRAGARDGANVEDRQAALELRQVHTVAVERGRLRRGVRRVSRER